MGKITVSERDLMIGFILGFAVAFLAFSLNGCW